MSLLKRFLLISNLSGDINCPPLLCTDRMHITYASDKEELSNSQSEYPIGTFAQIDCLDESRLTEGNSELICTEDGEWDGQMPKCESVEDSTENRSIIPSEPPKTTTISMEDEKFLFIPQNSSIATTKLDMTTEASKILLINIPERFWVEFRNFLFHGCQSTTYQSVLCKVTSRHRFLDLSHYPPKNAAGEKDVLEVLKRTASASDLHSLTIDSFYSRIIHGNLIIPEDSLRQFLSFAIDTIVWNFSNLSEYLQSGDHEVTNRLIQIVSPLFANFQLSYDFEELFGSIAPPTTMEVVTETVTPKRVERKSCDMSQLPQLANGLYEMVNGKVVYKCQDTFRLKGEFLVTCDENGSWEVVKTGSCQKTCELLQMPAIMRPQSLFFTGIELKGSFFLFSLSCRHGDALPRPGPIGVHSRVRVPWAT